MNDISIQLVRETLDLVEPIAPQATALFYANLFAADPSLATLFKGDMMVQGHRLTQMLAPAVSKLDEPEVGAALLTTLGQGPGVAYTPEVDEAWTEVYGVIASTMKAAAKLPA